MCLYDLTLISHAHRIQPHKPCRDNVLDQRIVIVLRLLVIAGLAVR
jgi:hypothetical protein